MEDFKDMDFFDPALTEGIDKDDGEETIDGISYTRTYSVDDNAIPINGVKTITYTVSWNDKGSHSINLVTRVVND